MAYDYAADLAFAREMIAEFGRPVTFQKGAEGAADANDPLAGPGAPPAPVAGVLAAFVYPSGILNLGASAAVSELARQSEQIAIVAYDGTNDFSEFDFIKDSDNSDWAITRVDTFQPGDTPLIYYVGVKRP